MLNQGLATIAGQGVKLSIFQAKLPNMASELIGGIMDLFQYR